MNCCTFSIQGLIHDLTGPTFSTYNEDISGHETRKWWQIFKKTTIRNKKWLPDSLFMREISKISPQTTVNSISTMELNGIFALKKHKRGFKFKHKHLTSERLSPSFLSLTENFRCRSFHVNVSSKIGKCF